MRVRNRREPELIQWVLGILLLVLVLAVWAALWVPPV